MIYAVLTLFVLVFTSLLVPAAAQDVFIVGVESNPAGPDKGNEWALLFNSGTRPIDLSGWSIVTEDGDVHPLHLTIPACDSMQVTFTKQFLDNKDAILALLDSEGTKIDKTPHISDSKNDDDTWNIPVPTCDGTSTTTPSDKPSPPPDARSVQAVPAVPGDILEVTFVDLGRAGESILLAAPGGTTMLIDGGLARSHDRLEQILDESGIDSIDIMVATHADQDHIQGLTSVMQNPGIDVRRVLLSHVDAPTKTYAEFMNSIKSLQIPSRVVYAGHAINLEDSFTARIISPPVQGISDSSGLRNTNSLVIHMEYGDISFLFTGDATAKTEKWIVGNVPSLDIDIMNGPHHGSHHSSTASFIDHVTPRLVVFSADEDNRYNHPHPDAVSRYDTRGIPHYQTGIDGSVVIRTDGVDCSIILTNANPIPCYTGIDVVGTSARPSAETAQMPETQTGNSGEAGPVPKWVKNTAKLWHEGRIADQQFVAGIQYLIENGIISVSIMHASTLSSGDIPLWIKANAGLWADGQIPDETFLYGIAFLIENGIIIIT